MQNYKSRILVDFDKGVITVETIDSNNSKKSLKNVIVTTIFRNSKEVKVYYVTIPMVKEHADIKLPNLNHSLKDTLKSLK